TNLTSTVLFLVIFILAFFPGAFVTIFRLPLRLLDPTTSPSNRAISQPARSSCCCTHAPPAPAVQSLQMSWFQKTFSLPSKSRGSYLITDHVTSSLPEIKNYKVGIVHLFVQHTSCALSMNENWDEEVREDMTDALERVVPYDDKGNMYRHSAEGRDDMPVSAQNAP
ncbi:hypothetical protein LTS18_008397, partial [Coniosporium uncinatum]